MYTLRPHILFNHAKMCFVVTHEHKEPLRGALCDIWVPDRLPSPRFTNLAHTRYDTKQEGVVPLQDHMIKKLAFLACPTSEEQIHTCKLGLKPGDFLSTRACLQEILDAILVCSCSMHDFHTMCLSFCDIPSSSS